MMSKVLYLIGSLRNKRIPELANKLRAELPDVEVFDDWYSAGFEADDMWKNYEQGRKREYESALAGYAAKHVFSFDKYHLDRATHVLLVLPAGKSGHMEIMYAEYGTKAKTAILLDEEDVRWDVMYQFIPTILRQDKDVINWISKDEATESKLEREIKGLFDGRKGTIIRGGRGTTELPTGGRPTGLLSKCTCGSRKSLEDRGGQAPPRRTSSLGTWEEYRSPKQDNEASY